MEHDLNNNLKFLQKFNVLTLYWEGGEELIKTNLRVCCKDGRMAFPE